MFNIPLIITRLTLREAARRKILWAGLIFGLLFLVVYGLGFHFMHVDIERSMQSSGGLGYLGMQEVYSFLTLSGLYAVNFLAIAISALTSIDTLSGEITSGTIQVLATKPLKRWQIVLGKWLGFVLMTSLYLLLMAGGTLAIVYALSGYLPVHLWRGFGLLWLNAVLILSLSFLGGSLLSTLANGVVIFGLYGVAFIGGWVEQFGAYLGNEVAVKIGVISSLILPSEALWKRAMYELQSPLVSSLNFSPFMALSVPSALMIVYAMVYALACLLLAIHNFGRRDL